MLTNTGAGNIKLLTFFDNKYNIYKIKKYVMAILFVFYIKSLKKAYKYVESRDTSNVGYNC